MKNVDSVTKPTVEYNPGTTTNPLKARERTYKQRDELIPFSIWDCDSVGWIWCYYNSMNCACLSIYWSAYLSSDIFRCFVELEHHQFELHPLQSIINWIEIEKLSVSILFYLFFRFLFVGLNSYNFRFDNTAYYEAIESTTPWLQGIEY